MNETKLYSSDEVCKILGVSSFTLSNWYNWESKQLKEGLVTEKYLPQPVKLEHQKGKPRRWTEAMVEKLKEYKQNIVIGRNGIYGMYSNPNHSETIKYKKSEKTVEGE